MNNNFYQFTDLEKSKLAQVSADPDMLEALRKAMLSAMYTSGTLRHGVEASPLKNSALLLAGLACSGQGSISNEDLGQDIRGLFHGIQLMEKGFKIISDFKPEETKVEQEDNTAI